MSEPKPAPIDELASAEERAGIVDQQTVVEAGIEQARDDEENEAHPT